MLLVHRARTTEDHTCQVSTTGVCVFAIYPLSILWAQRGRCVFVLLVIACECATLYKSIKQHQLLCAGGIVRLGQTSGGQQSRSWPLVFIVARTPKINNYQPIPLTFFFNF